MNVLEVLTMIVLFLLTILSVYSMIVEFYTVFLSLFGFKKAVKDYPDLEPEARFLILVAAHNEEAVIESTIKNLKEIDYPEHLYDLYIVNDNSTDRTGEICDACGVRHIDTIEGKFPREGVGKSAGLQYALRALGFEELKEKYDLLLVLDADNHIDNFLLKEVNSQWIHEGKPEAVQAYLDSKNAESVIATGYATAYNVTNRFFQLSKKRLKFNNAIGGTGFSVRMDWLINTGGFCYKSLVEDLEMSIEIFKSGGQVTWNHFARIYDEKPDTLGVSLRQRIRWCQGHWYVAFTNGIPLLKGWVKSKFNPRYIDQLIYLFFMGKSLMLVIFIVSTLAALGYQVAIAFDTPLQATGEFGATILRVLIPTNIARLFLMFYSYVFMPFYANRVDGTHKAPILKMVWSMFYVGITYIYAQIVGLLKWRQQNVWVKTPHKHTKNSVEEKTKIA